MATVTLCRPDVLAARAPATWTVLGGYGRDLPGDVRIVIVRGGCRDCFAGPGGAATPTDVDGFLGTLSRLPAVEVERRLASAQQAVGWLRRPDLVSIAAAGGRIAGAGLQLVLACDLRVLADDAEFVAAEAGFGLVPGLGGTKRLVELVGYARALEICVTGRPIRAADAERFGLATTVVPADRLDAAARELAATVLAASRDAVVEVKALLAAASGRSFPEQEAAERAAQARRIADLAGRGE